MSWNFLKVITTFVIIFETLLVAILFLQNNKLVNENVFLKKKLESVEIEEKIVEAEKKIRENIDKLIYTLIIGKTGPFATGFIVSSGKKIVLKIINESQNEVFFETSALKIEKTLIEPQKSREIEIMIPAQKQEYEYNILMQDNVFVGKLVAQ